MTNDAYGHLAGDAILQDRGQRLREAMRVSDTVARFGGDEFVVLTPELEQREGVLVLAHKLRAIVNEPSHWNGHTLEIRASIGMAIYPDPGTTQDALRALADTALDEARRCSASSIVEFNSCPSGNQPGEDDQPSMAL